MNLNQLMKIISVYLSGIFVIVIGVVALASGDQTIGLIIMLCGLGVALAGGIYGRRNLIGVKKTRMPEVSGLVEQAKGITKKEEIKDQKVKKEDKVKPKIKEKIVKYLECPQCKNENRLEAKFCDRCGLKLS